VSDLTVLRDPQSSMAHVMQAVTALEDASDPPLLRAGVSANITTDLLGTYLRRHTLLAGGRAVVEQGDFDSHLDNVRRFAEAELDLVVLINFFDQLMPAFEARAADLEPELVAAQRDRLVAETRLALEQAGGVKQVLVGGLHRFTAPGPHRRSAAVDAVVADYNAALERLAGEFANAALLSTAEVVEAVGREQAFNPRFYYRAKAPYQARFWDELARRILLATRGAGRYLYKVLALDCDNTLWGGIVGEALLDGIQLDPDRYPGNVYYRVQLELLALQRRGVLLCLCTKNNPVDVDEVLQRHPHMLIKDEHLIVKQVNWDDKVDNLRAIAAELDLGLDSIVFLDDSPFEVESVHERLPEVTAFSVPKNVYEYPALVRHVGDLFLSGRPDDGSADKTEQYRIRAAVRAEESRHATREEYLASLGLTVELRRDPWQSIARIAELTQKSNQFNLTTRRYTEAEITGLIEDDDAAVYSLGVSDRFGDSGLTGVAIVRYEGAVARVGSFLMSCRVLGRGVELSPWSRIAADARERGCERLEAEWLRTRRNAQVEDFFDRLGLEPVEASEERRTYRARLAELDFPVQPHIEIAP
jgi:FkbH-like protein